MSVTLVADRYAGALCDLVDEEDLDDLVEALHSLHDAFEPVMERVFRNPNVSEDKQLDLIENVFEGQDSDLLRRFCKLLVRKNRFRYFGAIVDACEDEVDRRLGRKPARVESAFDLDEPQRGSIRDQLGQLFDADIVIDEENTPELLAGLRVKIDDYLMDYSVEQQLEELRSRFTSSTI